MPNKPGLAAGINSSVIGFGSLIFNLLGTWVINPDNISPIGSGKSSIFGTAVTDRMPLMFYMIFGVCMAIILLCALLIHDVPKVKEDERQQITVEHALKTKEFWMLFIAFTLTTVGPVYLVQKYKEISVYLENMTDQSLAILGSIGAIFASCCKLLFGHLNDVYGFKTVYILMIGMILFVGVGINWGVASPMIFGSYICISYVNLGGHYTILAPICRLMYGNVTGMKIFGIVYITIGLGTAIALGAAILQGDIKYYAEVFTILSGLGLISFAAIANLNDKPIIIQDDCRMPLMNKQLELR